MMGYRRFAPKLCYQLSLGRLVPRNHLLRRIAEAIDFSFIYPLARPYYSHMCQPVNMGTARASLLAVETYPMGVPGAQQGGDCTTSAGQWLFSLGRGGWGFGIRQAAQEG
jgi:hypothetical protein